MAHPDPPDPLERQDLQAQQELAPLVLLVSVVFLAQPVLLARQVLAQRGLLEQKAQRDQPDQQELGQRVQPVATAPQAPLARLVLRAVTALRFQLPEHLHTLLAAARVTHTIMRVMAQAVLVAGVTAGMTLVMRPMFAPIRRAGPSSL